MYKILVISFLIYRDAGNSLARPGRKQARKHVKDARDFNNMETRVVIKFLFLQGKAQKEIHAILTETLPYFLPGRAKDLSAVHMTPIIIIVLFHMSLLSYVIYILCLYFTFYILICYINQEM